MDMFCALTIESDLIGAMTIQPIDRVFLTAKVNVTLTLVQRRTKTGRVWATRLIEADAGQMPMAVRPAEMRARS
jgi:hypothetical protein